MNSVDFDWNREPVLGICGRRGSGRTAVIAHATERLAKQGLRVGVLAGEPTGLGSRPVAHRELEQRITTLLADHDLVFIRGDEGTPALSVWCSGPGPERSPMATVNMQCLVPWDGKRVDIVVAEANKRLVDAHRKRRVCGAVLIGGASRRMGFPKHLSVVGGVTMVEHVLQALEQTVDQTLVIGAGQLPRGWPADKRVVDDAGSGAGPIAGILTAIRLQPRSSWVVVACDMVAADQEAVQWVLNERAPGRWAVLPKNAAGRVEPLLAVYEPQARSLLEDLRAGGRLAPRELARSLRVHVPPIPPGLRSRWRNVNRPEEFDRVRRAGL